MGIRRFAVEAALCAALALAPVAAAAFEVVDAVLLWENMGLMGPGAVSQHRVEVGLESETVRHDIAYHGGAIALRSVLYRTDRDARLRLLRTLGEAAEGWASRYESGVLDGSSWHIVLRGADGVVREFRGQEIRPPRADEIAAQVRDLAPFETEPNVF